MNKSICVSLVFVLLAAVAPGPSHAEEKGEVVALSAWEGAGQFVRSGPTQAFFVGGFKGTFFVQSQEGSLDAARIVCPGTMELNLEDFAQTGDGRCAITTLGGDQAFATWSCKGAHLVGCTGEFTLTGGTGRLEGITGGGPMVLRSAFAAAAAETLGEGVKEVGTGIAIWPKLSYTIP